MRTAIMTTPIALLLVGGAALAQSGQGGYLGENPGKNLPSVSQERVKPPSEQGSGQGGYLGENAGKNQPSVAQEPEKPPPEKGSGEGGYLGMVPGRATTDPSR
jgi:hypothetical protein